jgi:hypothetical protein
MNAGLELADIGEQVATTGGRKSTRDLLRGVS